MKTLEQIKNDYARKNHYKDFSDMVYVLSDYAPIEVELEEKFDEVMKIYAMECLKLASENAFNNDVYLGYGDISESKVKESITNENNIIK